MSSSLVVKILHTPHPRLNPNDKMHAMAKGSDGISRATARKILKESAHKATISAINGRAKPWLPGRGRIQLELFVFWENNPLQKRPYFPDEDNLIASCKALIDGLAAGLGVNDKRFKIAGVEQERDADGAGFVVARLTPLEG